MDLTPGTLGTWQSSSPYEIDAVTPFGLVVAYIPRAMLGAHADRLYRATATPIGDSTGRSRLLRAMLVQIARGLQSGDLDTRDAEIAESLLRLLRGAPADRAGRSGVAAVIRRARLERCRQDLLDPRLADHTIFEIATRWGFVSAPHFTRTFHRTYDCTPSE